MAFSIGWTAFSAGEVTDLMPCLTLGSQRGRNSRSHERRSAKDGSRKLHSGRQDDCFDLAVLTELVSAQRASRAEEAEGEFE